MSTLTKDAEAVAAHLESMKAGERIAWLHETYGNRVVASSSFGLQAAVMLHLISENAPEIPVVFIDTGYLFPETYHYIEKLSSFLKVNLRHYVPKMTAAHQESLHGKLWNSDPKEYARINKVEPMNRALKEIGGDIWLSGLRRSQSSTRSERGFAEQQGKTMKVYPILDWADAQVASYFQTYALPQHPLSKKGYVTMGDWHSTRKPETGESDESTRFNGEKYECGLHEESGHLDFQI